MTKLKPLAKVQPERRNASCEVIDLRLPKRKDTHMTKLDEKFAERAACRETLLELRKRRAEKDEQHRRLRDEASELDRRILAEQKRFVEATTEVGQLLHADLASIMPGSVTRASEPAPAAEMSAQ